MTDPRAAAEALRELRGFGLHLALDDFGTGYSSLTYLKRFPFEAMKVDRSFVAGLAVNADDTADRLRRRRPGPLARSPQRGRRRREPAPTVGAARTSTATRPRASSSALRCGVAMQPLLSGTSVTAGNSVVTPTGTAPAAPAPPFTS